MIAVGRVEFLNTEKYNAEYRFWVRKDLSDKKKHIKLCCNQNNVFN